MERNLSENNNFFKQLKFFSSPYDGEVVIVVPALDQQQQQLQQGSVQSTGSGVTFEQGHEPSSPRTATESSGN